MTWSAVVKNINGSEGMTKYEKTKDPNIIKQTETVESEIHRDKLEIQVVNLETQITNIPAPIEKGKYPDEVLALIDEHNMMIPDKSELETELKKKQDLLNKLKGL